MSSSPVSATDRRTDFNTKIALIKQRRKGTSLLQQVIQEGMQDMSQRINEIRQELLERDEEAQSISTSQFKELEKAARSIDPKDNAAQVKVLHDVSQQLLKAMIPLKEEHTEVLQQLHTLQPMHEKLQEKLRKASALSKGTQEFFSQVSDRTAYVAATGKPIPPEEKHSNRSQILHGTVLHK